MTVADEPASDERALDVRLAAGAVGAWLAVLLCSAAGPALSLGTAIASGLGAVLLLSTRRGRRFGAALPLVLFCASLVLLPLSARIVHARASPLVRLAAQHAQVTAQLTVSSDPVTLAATGTAGAPRVAVQTSAVSVTVAGRAVAAGGGVFVLADAAPWHDVLPGQRVSLDGDLQPDLGGSSLSVTMFARGEPRFLGRPPWWQRTAGSVRTALRASAAGLPPAERGLLPGLIDGDTAGLDPVLAERFRLAGLTHLVAVSGTNCSLVIGAVLLVLRRLRVRPWVCAVLGAAVLVMFVVVARPSPSVLRAALMASIALVSLASGRPRSALPALSAVTIALLLWDPALAGSASFGMSVLATAALLVIAPGWAAGLRRRGVPVGLAEPLAVAAAAHVVTAPVVAAISGRVSLVAIPANVLAEPVVGLTTILGFVAAVIAPWWLPGAAGLAWLAGWPCRWLVAVAEFFGGLHGATLPWPGSTSGGLLLLAVTGVVWVLAIRAGPRRVLVAAAATALIVLIPVRSVTSGWPPSGWVFVACDVGQGDALVLNAGAGTAVEIDAGPDPIAIDRCLRDLHVTTIALLLLSHFHLDHVGGLPGVSHGRRVLQLLSGPLAAPATGTEIVDHFARTQGLTDQNPPAGTSLQVGAVHLDVLGPAGAFHDTRSDPNNSSLILRATVGGLRILLPGDAEIEAQQAMLRSGVDLRADVLKVPHHGSAYSDPAFLAAVHASVGVISVGLHNDYGHPSPILLNEMARLGVPVLRTDRDGDVAVVAEHGHPAVVTRGVAASTVGLGPAIARPAPGRLTARVAVRSVLDAKMTACPPARSPSTTCPPRCRASSCSSATRSCSSTARSARSPPLPAGPTPRSPKPSLRGARSTGPSCTSSWGRRCSVRPA